MPIPDSPQRDIYSVSRLVRETRAVLEGSFPLLWVSGEISNLAQPASGHIYFGLKDEIAQAVPASCSGTAMDCHLPSRSFARGEEKSEHRHDHEKYHVY